MIRIYLRQSIILVKFEMRKHEPMQIHSLLINKQQSKSKFSRDSISKSKDLETLCISEHELKHAQAIRPYCSKERKTTRRDSRCTQSPHLSRSKSKRFDSSAKKTEQMSINIGGKQLGQMYSELINLKSQYKLLKANNNKVAFQNNQLKKKLQENEVQKDKELQIVKRQFQRQKKMKIALQQQMQRIKKQFCRIVQLQRFKLKKFEQTLQQKELMIAFLRNQLQKNKKNNNPDQNKESLFYMNNSIPLFDFDYLKKQTQNISSFSHIHEKDSQKNIKSIHIEEDSLSLSRDKSKEADSIIHSFLSQDQSILPHNFMKKQFIIINSLQQSPIQTKTVQVIDEISQKSDAQPKNSQFSEKQMIQKEGETISVLAKVKSRLNHKKLQISVVDENMDTNNISEEVAVQTKKKSITNNQGFKPKKKMTAKKPKPTCIN